jgi:2-phosphosulfolactate phosphatase
VLAHVAFSPGEIAGDGLRSETAVVIDVMRAATTVVTAIANGASRIVPALTVEEARARADSFPSGEVLLGGEREGEPPQGFHLGNSPREYASDRVSGKVIVFTTTNGTRAMAAAAPAASAAVCAFVNVGAVARWVLSQERDLTVICAGEKGRFSLEDAVCAGMLLARLVSSGAALACTDAALAARILYGHYSDRLDRLGEDSAWARKLERAGHAEDLAACLRVGVLDQVPVLRDGAVVGR